MAALYSKHFLDLSGYQKKESLGISIALLINYCGISLVYGDQFHDLILSMMNIDCVSNLFTQSLLEYLIISHYFHLFLAFLLHKNKSIKV